MSLGRNPRRYLAVLIVLGLLGLAGCMLDPSPVEPPSTGPVDASPVTVPANPDAAPIADASMFGTEGKSSVDAEAEVTTGVQEAALSELQGLDPEVIGTAASVFKGRPVLLALTRSRSGKLPRVVQGKNVVEFVVGDVRAQSYYCGTSTSRVDRCAAGTLGAIVTDGIRYYWLSNWHVFADPGTTGDNICSPGRYDAACGITPSVGTLSRFVPVRFDGTANTVDCAIARIIPGLSVSPIQSAGSSSYLPSGYDVAPSVNMAVKKVGRTTGFTTGTIIGVNATLNVKYGTRTAKFTGVVLTSAACQPGDSGSLICERSTNRPVALLFAGSSGTAVGCPIGKVFTAIGAHIAH